MIEWRRPATAFGLGFTAAVCRKSFASELLVYRDHVGSRDWHTEALHLEGSCID